MSVDKYVIFIEVESVIRVDDDVMQSYDVDVRERKILIK